jgi:hypothetical protein
MKTIIFSVCALAAAVEPALADSAYDHNLEKAAAEIVAGKMGDLRGGFAYKDKLRLVRSQSASAEPAASAAPHSSTQTDASDNALVPAVEEPAG